LPVSGSPSIGREPMLLPDVSTSRGTGRPEMARSQSRRHEPHQAPGQGFFQRFAGEVLFVGELQRHHPLAASVIGGPRAKAAAGGDRPTVRLTSSWMSTGPG
jgi:hypothetical protein